MNQDVEPVPSKVQELLDAERPLGVMPASARNRVWSRLQPLATTRPPSGGQGLLHAVGKAARSRVAIAAVGVGVGGMGGAVLQARLRAPLIPWETGRVAAQPVAAPSVPPLAQPPPGPHGDAALARERALLDQARTALTRANSRGAFEAIGQHEREFPSGALSEEREALRVEALLTTGQREAARAAELDFEAKYPKSMALPALKEGFDREP